ncbi:OB-fold nucleic acid binding domain-containing protein [Methanococcus sp. CF]
MSLAVLNDKKITFLCILCVVFGISFLSTYKINPEEKHISDLDEGDYVKVTAKIQKLDVKTNEYLEVMGINSVKLMDETAGDLLLYVPNDISGEFLEYILKTSPRIKEGDIVKVSGKIQIYNGRYEIVLKDMDDFQLIKKVNFERDIFLSKTKTSYYASKNSNVYHDLENCPYGQKIVEKIYFKTEDDAIDLGYEKCSYCEKWD